MKSKHSQGGALDPLNTHTIDTLEEATRKALTDKLRVVRFQAGQLIFSDNDLSTDMCFVLTGTVRLVKFSPSGKVLSFRYVSEGGFFGEFAMIDQLPRSASVYADKAVTLGLLGLSDARLLIASFPDFTWMLMKQLAATVRRTNLRLEQLNFLNANQRVYAALIDLAATQADSAGNPATLLAIPPQERWAQLLDISRETLARALSGLIDDQIIRKTARSIEVLDWPRLLGLIDAC